MVCQYVKLTISRIGITYTMKILLELKLLLWSNKASEWHLYMFQTKNIQNKPIKNIYYVTEFWDYDTILKMGDCFHNKNQSFLLVCTKHQNFNFENTLIIMVECVSPISLVQYTDFVIISNVKKSYEMCIYQLCNNTFLFFKIILVNILPHQ